MIKRILMKKMAVRKNTVIYSPVRENTALRNDKSYIEKKELPDEYPEYVVMRAVLDGTGDFSAFVDFLLDAVKPDSEGKLTIDEIWTSWSLHNEVDGSKDVVGGIRRVDVPEHIRDILDVGAMTRLRIDGAITRCWIGWSMP